MNSLDLKGKRVLVFGLGRFGGGIGVTRFLVQQGATVTVTDKAPAEALQKSIDQLAGLPITYRLGGHDESDILQCDLLIANPAISYNSPWLKFAQDRGIPITSEMNLFFERCPAPIVAVTGSNGKSTTTSMIAHVLEAAAKNDPAFPHKKIWLGGNIGLENLLQWVHEIRPSDMAVLELSSFQLYDLGRIRKSPHIAVVTNISPNHLDWHGTMDHYRAAKQNILRFQTPSDYAVLNRLAPELEDWAKLTPGKTLWSSNPGEPHIDIAPPGCHNQQNASAALAVASILRISDSLAREALKTYKALPHRLELIREVASVRYYNDSIATTPESVIAAIDAFSEPKIILLGGYDKKIPFDELVAKLIGNVHAVVLLGQVRDKLFDQIEQAKRTRAAKLPLCLKAEDFPNAVELARQNAPPGSVVLLSPACASYDMFQNFQHRGESFRSLVQQLPE